MTSTIHSIPADSAEYAKDYNNGWRVSQRAADWDGNGLSPLERADERGVSNAWYDGFEDYACGHDKWRKRQERLDGDHEPETMAYDCPCCGTVVYGDSNRALCADCVTAECEPNRSGAYDECKRPCESCGDPRSSDFYVCVVYERSDGETDYSDGYVCSEHESDAVEAFTPSGATVLESTVSEITR
jgi:hypothetical protein